MQDKTLIYTTVKQKVSPFSILNCFTAVFLILDVLIIVCT